MVLSHTQTSCEVTHAYWMVLIVLYTCRFVAGVIAQERLATFERVLWRACRGNVFIRQASITDPLEDPTTVCIPILLLSRS